MKNYARVVILVALVVVGVGCATKDLGPNRDVMWAVPVPSPDKIPITASVLGAGQPMDTEAIHTCYGHLKAVADKAGLGEVFAFTAGEDVTVPETQPEAKPQENPTKGKKDKEQPKPEGTAGLRKVAKEEITGLVLTSADLGIVALEKNNLSVAEGTLDTSLQMMTSFGGNEKNLKKAVSLWGSESMKDFKGEPHERAVVFFWRGLAYIAKGDLENARACFMSANLEDQFAKDINKRGNSIAADLMERQCSCWIGDEMDKAASERMEHTYSGLTIPAASKENTVAIVFALGYPPLKQAAGYHGSQLAYLRAETQAEGAAVMLAAQATPRRVEPAEDLVMQAVSRGARAMDDRLAKEAKTKDRLKKGGDIMEQVGGQLPYIGIVFQLGGQAMRGAGTKARAFADTRSLLTIPSYLAVAFVKPQDLQESSKLQILDGKGGVLTDVAIPPIPDSAKPTVILVRYKGFPADIKAVVDPNAPKEQEQPKKAKKK